ncbi:unnamed protein product [Closterium sp. Naga37s-1]|nr:unnamed protein product [Closterium sp. Naga37s-1]
MQSISTHLHLSLPIYTHLHPSTPHLYRFLGSHLLQQLLAAGHTVRCLCRQPNTLPPHPRIQCRPTHTTHPGRLLLDNLKCRLCPKATTDRQPHAMPCRPTNLSWQAPPPSIPSSKAPRVIIHPPCLRLSSVPLSTRFLPTPIPQVVIGSLSDPSALDSLLQGSLSDPSALESLLQGTSGLFHLAGVVIHSRAATSAPPQQQQQHPTPTSTPQPSSTAQHPSLDQTTVDGTLAVLEAALKAGVKRIVYASTSGTVGAFTDSRQVASDDSPYAREVVGGWPYYRAKIEAEERARGYAEQHGLELVCMRPTLILGPGGLREFEGISLCMRQVK